MQTVDDIRRGRLLRLIAEHGTQSALAKAIGKSPAQISQWVNRSPDSKTGKPRVMDSATAREIERACGKPVGWMDQPLDQFAAPVVQEQSPAFNDPLPLRLARSITELMSGLDPLVAPSAKETIRKLLDGELTERQAADDLTRLQAMSAAGIQTKRTGTG